MRLGHRSTCYLYTRSYNAAIFLVAAWMFMVACSGDHRATDVSDPAVLELYGTYEWNPRDRFHNSVWSGELKVDGRCVYLELSPQTVLELSVGDAQIRSFVRLPEPLTSYDPVTGELWVDDHGPMSHGDDVVLVGSQGWQIEGTVNEEDGMHHFAYDWEHQQGCPAHVSFWTASMIPAASASSESLAAAESPDPVVGLFEWDIEVPENLEDPAGGVLVVEKPCLFLDGFTHSGLADEWETRWEDRLYLLYLPRPLVRFDDESGSVWMGDNGPMKSGDEVLLASRIIHDSVKGWELYEGSCRAQGTFHSTAMRPRN